MQPTNSLRRQVLLGIFVVSGFTGLIYESIWSHYLKLFLGHAAYAQTLVLAIFMGGMALGSWIVARYSARIRQLLFGYVIVEGVIGVFGLVFHGLFVGATDWSFESVIPALSSPAAIHAFKWSLAALLILPQSTLLGMTFPLISGGIIRRWPSRPGEVLSMLYFTNSLGAALGVLVSGFVLIKLVGLPGTIGTAGILNVLLAIAVWAIVKKDYEPAPQAQPVSETSHRNLLNWFVIAAFVTGAASFLYEIAWIRMLSLVLGSSTHSFELMLSAFIFGLACGGFWMRNRLDAVRDSFRYLGIVMIAMGTMALLTLPAYNQTFDFMAWAMSSLTPTAGGYTVFNLTAQLLAALIMIPTTFLAGMTLPMLTRALFAKGGERAIGTVYAANTLGAIVGVLVAVHLLLPYVGVKGVVAAGAAAHMAVGVSSLARSARERVSRYAITYALAVVCVAILSVVVLATTLDPRRMTSGVYRTQRAAQPLDAKITYLRHGKTATISLLEREGTVVIATNGKPDAGIQMGGGPASKDEITMILAAALPLSMHPSPKRVANIGFGSGLTGHAILGSPHVEWLDSIEIEPFMVEAAKQGFYKRVSRVFDEPRSRIFFEDAKTFFATQRQPYDIIISEPSNPWVSGVATLFSDEFYARIVNHLSPDGYLVQWLQIYETDMEIVASILKALSPHFQDFAIYNADDTNILVVATPKGRLNEPTDIVFKAPGIRNELERVGIESLAHLKARKIGDRRTLGALIASYGAPANSDFFPFVDLNAPRHRFLKSNALEFTSFQILPFPLIELLGEVDTTAYPEDVSDRSLVRRDYLVLSARNVLQALRTGSFESLFPEISHEIVMLDLDANLCKNSSVRETWRRAVRQVSDLTTPYLPPEDLEPLWHKITASNCYRHDGPHVLWTDLFRALAQRDSTLIESVGTQLLDATDWLRSPEELDYLATVVAGARLAVGRPTDALKVLESNAAINSGAAERYYMLAQRWLGALAHAHAPAQVAGREGRTAPESVE